jgi:cellulose synthase/poly-beta-1,6-N-acetylglucosamine synthase-like glycosyltransferase
MALIHLLTILILIDYILFIGLLIYGFNKIKTYKINTLKSKTSFSIIVPFRNESKNILDLLASISNLNYPKNLFEIIFIDDDSIDYSAAIFNKWRVQNGWIQSTLLQNLRLTNSPKKDAISRAIPIVKNQWIITTDADCVVQPDWLATLDNYIQNNDCQMIAGLVCISRTKRFLDYLNYFQYLDMISLQASTIGSFGLDEAFMCNGANFAYTKKLFLELKGFDGNANLASGDDVFLLQKAIKNNPKEVHYLKNRNSIVYTKSEKTITKLFMQRLRWASKTGAYHSDFAKGLAVVVLLMNVYITIGVVLWLTNYLKNENFLMLLFAFIIKIILDNILLWKMNNFITKSKFFFPIISSFVYPFFCTIVGLYSFFGSFSWKGRRFKK